MEVFAKDDITADVSLGSIHFVAGVDDIISIKNIGTTEESDTWVASKRARGRGKKMPSKNKKLIKSARTDSDDDGDSALLVSSSQSKTASRKIESLATSSDESKAKEPP